MNSTYAVVLADVVVALLSLALFVSLWRAVRRRRRGGSDDRPTRRRRGGSVGPGAAGAFYEFLNEDKRAAIEIVVEERTAYRDPEDRDGDLPQLERPGRTRSERPPE